MTNSDIYESIATRTGGSVYIGVVGPVRNGQEHIYQEVYGYSRYPEHHR